MKHARTQLRVLLVGLASVILMVTVMPQLASAVGLGALAHRLLDNTTCSSGSGSGSGSGSWSSGSSGSSSTGTCCSDSSGSDSGASGSGWSGSGSSSQCGSGSGPALPGQVSGLITITNEPSGFLPGLEGVAACPYTGSATPFCSDPQVSEAQNGAYSISLDPGTWTLVAGFQTDGTGYYLSQPLTVQVASGDQLTRYFTVAYQTPGTVNASVTLTSVPAHIAVGAGALFCPTFAPFNGSGPSIACFEAGQGGGPAPVVTRPTPTSIKSTFQVTGVPPGSWIMYAGQCSDQEGFYYGCTYNPAASTQVVVTSGGTTKASASTKFSYLGNGVLQVSEVVSGAPVGFSDATALEVDDQYGNEVGYSQSSGVGPTTTSFLVPAGTVQATGSYTIPTFGNAVDGPSFSATVMAGAITKVTVVVPYQQLGTANVSVKPSGVPAGMAITGYSVSACPANALVSFNGNTCVEVYSGTSGGGGIVTVNGGGLSTGASVNPFAARRSASVHAVQASPSAGLSKFTIPVLTAGQWSFTAEFSTAFGYGYSTQPVLATVIPGQSVTVPVPAVYQPSGLGAVAGQVHPSNLPAASSPELGVQACSVPLVEGLCSGDLWSTYSASGAYDLPIPPGAWWVYGTMITYAPGGTSACNISASGDQVQVTESKITRQNLSVAYSATANTCSGGIIQP